MLTLGIARTKAPALFHIFGRFFRIKIPAREMWVRGPMVDGKYTKDTVLEESPFDPSDHRAYRRMHWLKNSIEKLNKIDFMFAGKPATVGQIAIKFTLMPEIMASCLPTMTSVEQIDEYASACDIDDIPQSEIDQLASLYTDNFGVGEPDPQKSSVSDTGWVDHNNKPFERSLMKPGD